MATAAQHKIAKRYKFTRARAVKFLEFLAQTGNVTHSAQLAKAHLRDVYKLRKQDTAFEREWDDALEKAADVLELEARRRAVEGVDDPVYYHGEVVGHTKKYSDTLLIFLLKGIRPEKYRERKDVTGTLSVKQSFADFIQGKVVDVTPKPKPDALPPKPDK